MHRECILSVGTNSFHKIHSSTTKPHLPTRLERRATLPIIQVQTPAAGTTPHPSSPAHPVFAEEHFDSIIAVRVRVPAQLDLDPPPIIGSYVLDAPQSENGHDLIRDPRGEFRGKRKKQIQSLRERVRRA